MQVRVAYVIAWAGGAETGPFKKMAAQARTWSELGAEVGLFVATSGRAAEQWRDLPSAVSVRVPEAGRTKKLGQRVQVALDAHRWGPDVVYERHGLFQPALTYLSRRHPTVLEINGDDLAEWWRLDKRKFAYDVATRGFRFRSVAGAVFVARGLKESRRFRHLRHRPALVAPNGVSLADVLPLPPSSAHNRLVFAGHPRSPWHGLERLMRLATQRPDWTIDIVGPGPADLPAVPRNVTLHGLLQGDAYRKVVGQATVAVSSLAMSRAGLTDASPLKTREYLALGLPVIVGYQDTDFPDPTPHVLRVPDTDEGLIESVDAIDEFLSEWRGRRVPRSDIEFLDMATRERERLDFLRQIASAPASARPA